MFKDKKKLYIGVCITVIFLLIIILLIIILSKDNSKPNNDKKELAAKSLIEEVALLNNKQVSDYKKYNESCPITKDSIIADYIIQTDNKIYGVDLEKGTDCKLLYTLDNNYKINSHITYGRHIRLVDGDGTYYTLNDENFDYNTPAGSAPTFERSVFKLNKPSYDNIPAKNKYFNTEDNLTWEWDLLYILQNKLYVRRSTRPNVNSFDITEIIQLIKVPEDEKLLRISVGDGYTQHFLKTDKSYYVITQKYSIIEGTDKVGIGLNAEYVAVKFDLLTKYYDEVLGTYKKYIITTDGYIIPYEDIKFKDVAQESINME